MRVAVLGAGNGGVASAFDFAQHGHEVALYATEQFGDNVVAVAEAGGISAHGDLEGPAEAAGDLAAVHRRPHHRHPGERVPVEPVARRAAGACPALRTASANPAAALACTVTSAVPPRTAHWTSRTPTSARPGGLAIESTSIGTPRKP